MASTVPIQAGQQLMVPAVIVKTDDGGNILLGIFDRRVAVDTDDLANWGIRVETTAQSTTPRVASQTLPPTTLVQPAGQPSQTAVLASSLAKGTLVQQVTVTPPASVVAPPTSTDPATIALHPGCMPPLSIFAPGTDYKAAWQAWQIAQGKIAA